MKKSASYIFKCFLFFTVKEWSLGAIMLKYVDDGHIVNTPRHAMYSTAGHALYTNKLAKAEFATTTIIYSKLSS